MIVKSSLPFVFSSSDQGLNTGVVLLDLARMRAGRLYQRAASPDTMAWLSDKYEYTGSVGDQVGGRMVVRVLQCKDLCRHFVFRCDSISTFRHFVYHLSF